jgi:hypothetical protein
VIRFVASGRASWRRLRLRKASVALGAPVLAALALRLTVNLVATPGDIAGGKRAGLTTILVLSGTTAQEHLAAAALQPDLVLLSLAVLVGEHRQ